MTVLNAMRWIWLALIGLQALWFGLLDPVGASVMARVGGVALFALPLLLPARGIWRRRPRAELVGGMLLLVYFCVAVAEAWVAPAARVPAALQIALIVVYFNGLLARRRAGS